MIRSNVLIAILLATAGCQSMGAKKSPDFIAPLAMEHVANEKIPTPKNERELCIRTAATVAGSGHLSEAIALYEKAERLDPQTDPLDRQLAPLYAQTDQAEKAIARYQGAINRSPHDAELRNNFTWTLLELGRVEQALAAVEDALKKFPEHRRLQSTRALALYRQGNRTAAFQQFASLYGSSAAHHNMALLDIEAGDEANARRELTQALAQTPSAKTIELATAVEAE